MYFERKVYETRSQKVGDFFLGIGLFIAVNIASGVISTLFTGIVVSMSSAWNSSALQTLSGLLIFLVYVLPFAVQVGLLIYFGLTRYWIALGILGAFAVSLLLVLLFVAACFVMIYGYNGIR